MGRHHAAGALLSGVDVVRAYRAGAAPLRAALAGCAMLAAGLAMTSCGSGGGAGAGPERPLSEPSLAAATPSLSPGAAQTLPLRAYAYSDEQLRVLGQAEGILTRDCMRRLGFTAWTPAEPSTVDRSGSTGLRIGVVDEQQAARHGYHDPKAGRKVYSTATRSAQDRAELAALSGLDAGSLLPDKAVPPGGCAGEAVRKLREGRPPYDTALYGRLVGEAVSATEADRRVVAALSAWSGCMRQAGYRYAAPWDAAEQVWAESVTPVEIATATADVRCKASTGLPGIWFAVQRGYEAQLVERHQPALDAVKKAIEADVRRAGEIVRAGR